MATKKRTYPATPEWYSVLEAQYMDALAEKQAIEEKIADIKQTIQDMMEAEDLFYIKSNSTKVTKIPARIKMIVDSKLLEGTYPNIYNKCLKPQSIKEYITIAKLN